ncbi:MAG TPA: hypothetical protein VKA46_13855 [Gemmataceae bacterium]|nr:hypothetical protein [Gemmataceae bacterium]
MSTAPAAQVCPLCAGPLADDRQPCPQCHASPEWVEMGLALDFTLRRFEEWHKQGRIGQKHFRELSDSYAHQREVCGRMAREGQPVPDNASLPSRLRCWSCPAYSDPPPDYCAECGAPWDLPAARSLRFWTFLAREIDRQSDAGRLSLNVAHDLKAEVRERRNALCQKLEKQRLSAVTAAAPEDAARSTKRRRAPDLEEAPAVPAAPRRSAWEILLDPRTIQWLLCLGGALFVVGLVILLAVEKFFENASFVAVLLGVANAAVLGGGWAIIARTRYQTAGRALTLLACLVMPLNLWFYDYNHLIEFDHNLWVPALVCCVLYAASALLLRDHLFVYVLFGGIALTGLLILADRHHFHEIALPSTLLVVLGLIGLHLERAFPQEEDGPFTRRRFGMACFWSGQALLGAGLLLLLGGQVAGWLHGPFLQGLGLAEAPDIYTVDGLQLLAILLVLAGTYAYVYSDVVVRRVGVYMYLAVFTLLWAEALVVRLLHLSVAMEAVIAVLALTALALNLLYRATAARASGTLARAMPPLGVFLATLPVALGALLHFRATNAAIKELWSYDITWWYVGAMALTAVSCRVGAYLYRHTLPWVSMVYFFGTAAATLAGAAGLLYLVDLKAWDRQATILMLVPILYLIASRVYRGHTAERPLIWVAHAATAFMVLGVLTASLQITPQVATGSSFFEPTTRSPSNLLWAAFCAEAALFYGLASGLRKEGWTIYPATAMACGAVWQLLLYSNVITPEYYALAFALLGFALLVAYRLALLERFEKGGLAPAAFGSANALMSLAFLAAALLALSRLAAKESSWSLAGLLLALAALSLAASWLVRHPVWRPWYVVMGIAEALLMFVAVEMAWDLTVWQKAEIFSVVVGVVLLMLGHWGWHREQAPDTARQSESVSLALLFGSLLTALPLAVAVLIHRGGSHHFSKPDELGMLSAGVLLLASGFMLRLRSTALIGASLLGLYLLTLPMLIKKIAELEWSAILLMSGGGLVLGLGLVLSIFHDRLRTLPEKIKRREGIFRVLSWR